MARYTINYDNGTDGTIEADAFELIGDQYVGYRAASVIALIPFGNVLSIVRQDDEAVTD